MNYIVKFANFNESKGICDSCDKVLIPIFNSILNDILSYKSGKISYDINESDFRTKCLIIEYDISKGVNNRCRGVSMLKESEIINDFLTNSKIKLNIETGEFDDEFIYYIKSVLLHEILHVFQHYNILIGSKFRPESFSIGSVIPQLRKIVKTKYALYFLDILYYSLSHEISAQLHQYYLYKSKNKNYKKIDDILGELKSFNSKKLTMDESSEIDLIKKHLIGSIKFHTTNKKYLKKIDKSIWSISSNIDFLEKFKSLLNDRVKWVNKKIKMIDKKIESCKNIRYDETIFLPSDWDNHDFYDEKEHYLFILENLSDRFLDCALNL
jgi:hypothetical protein